MGSVGAARSLLLRNSTQHFVHRFPHCQPTPTSPCTLHLALCSPISLILHHQSHCNPNPQHLASAYSRSFCISLLQPRHHQQLVAGYSQLLVACSKYLTPLPTNSLRHLRFSSESFQSLSGVSSILLHPRPHVRGLPHRGLPPPDPPPSQHPSPYRCFRPALLHYDAFSVHPCHHA